MLWHRRLMVLCASGICSDGLKRSIGQRSNSTQKWVLSVRKINKRYTRFKEVIVRRTLLVLGLAAVVGASSLPVGYMFSAASGVSVEQEEDDTEAWEDEEEWQCTLERSSFGVNPAKKTIKVGKSFFIKICPSDDFESEYGNLSDEEWDKWVDKNIDGITFRSTKKSVAAVNSKGKVKGKKKGSAIIKTTVIFQNGSEGVYKTKVYVAR